MYLCLVLTSAAIAWGYNSPDFGLVGQVYLWTGSASLGGIVADSIASRRGTRHWGC
jgi:hypothetical protein